jgi:iron complex outermembrane receptor protein
LLIKCNYDAFGLAAEYLWLMNRRLPILLFILLQALCIFAQKKLVGYVLDKETGTALLGAAVYLPDLKQGVQSDSNGRFFFNNVPEGNMSMEVRLIGYAPKVLAVDASKSGQLIIMLSQTAGELSEVAVTGVSKATEIRRSPIPIIAIDKAYLNSVSAGNIIEAIAHVPGVSALSSGPNISKPQIRGLGFNRVLTLYDGNRQEGQQWGDEHGIEVDQYAIERVEIIKGPASLSYGSDALAGVVNLIPAKPAPEGRLQGNILAEYGSNNGLLGTSGLLKGTKKGIDFILRLSHKQATNYQNPIDGRVFGTAFSENDASAGLGFHGQWGYAHANFSLYDDLQEIPDGSRDSSSRKFTKQITEADFYRPIVSQKELSSYKIAAIHQHVQHYRANTNYKFFLKKGGDIELFTGYQMSRRREYSHPEYQTTPGLFLELHTLSFDLSYRMKEIKGWNFLGGINGMYQINQVNKGTEFVIPSYHQFDIGPFAVARKAWNKLEMEAGIRFDLRAYSNTAQYLSSNTGLGFDRISKTGDSSSLLFPAYHKLFNGISGSLGASYIFSDRVSVKANIARGYRSPNIAEISANGVHPGTNIYQLGNQHFKSEFSWQADLGLHIQSTYVVLGVDVFYNYIQNYIYNQKLLNHAGQDSALVAGNQTFQFQSAAAQLYGGEMSIDIHPFRGLHVENSLSLVYGDFLGNKGKAVADSERYLPFVPPFHGYAEIRYDFNIKKAHLISCFVKMGLNYYSKQNHAYTAFGTETSTPGYALLSAAIGTGISNRKGQEVLNILLSGNNLLNAAYQDHLSRMKYFEPYPGNYTGRNGIYNMGRNITLKLSVPLNFKW